MEHIDDTSEPATPTRARSIANVGGDVLARACVLIVDDAPENVALLERVLRNAGVDRVHGVTDPREAVTRAIEVDADLVLLDLHMPFLDGFGVMAQLQERLPEDAFLPVLVLTADATAETRDRALAAGAKDLLHKPFDLKEIRLRVRNLLETRLLYTAVQQHNSTLQADLDRRSEEDRRGAAERAERRERIQGILAGAAFSMVYQPIIDLNGGAIVGAEALARFPRAPQRPPNEWFDEAAAVGLGAELELAAAAAGLAGLEQLPPELSLSVNVSPATAIEPGLLDLLSGVPGDRVVLELTEHTPVHDYRPLATALASIRERGVRIAVDDTGAGYSGLQHLLRLAPDVIKLDIGLTSGIDVDPAKRALSTALVTFAADIGARVVAEGIETHAELAALRGLGIGFGQGYLLARPSPLPLRASQLEATATEVR